MSLLRHLAAIGISVLSGTSLWAGDIALVLSNAEYDSLPDFQENLRARGLATALRDNGFRVLEQREMRAADLRDAARQFEAELARDPGRAIVVLTGHFAESGGQVWMLGRDASLPGRITVSGQGLSVNALAAALAPAQGQALLVMATPGAAFSVNPGVRSGNDGFEAPQGVTVLRGPVHGVRDVVEQGFLAPGQPIGEVAANLPRDVQLDGFVPPAIAFTSQQSDPLRSPDFIAELAYWEAARDIGTIDSARAYLNRYPSGHFAGDARGMINDILNSAQRRAQEIETALNLTRDDRMQIQRDLSILGFDPRGIDGVIGQGTRAAVLRWQAARGFAQTGYLDRLQLRDLRQQAEARAAELEEEARRRQAEQERLDRDYWRGTGAGSSEEGLRDYLRRYPDGLFADEARDRLARIQEERLRNAAKAERKAWDQAVQQDTMAAYQGFLNKYPGSQFAGAARDRLAELQDMNANRENIARARTEEEVILSNDVTRLLVERRLAQMGLLAPQQVDGTINEKTRQAIRRFQRSRDIYPTGYVSQLTMVQLLATLGEPAPRN